jgi:3-hydroxyisobutyrate dehydrogenase-like beta-hydroxyacid dehydrogenase
MLKHLICPSSEIKEIRFLNLESQERQNNAYATGASAVEKSIPRELTKVLRKFRERLGGCVMHVLEARGHLVLKRESTSGVKTKLYQKDLEIALRHGSSTAWHFPLLTSSKKRWAC